MKSDLLKSALSGLRRDSLRAKAGRDASRRPALMLAMGLADEEPESPIEEAEAPMEDELAEDDLALLEDEDEEAY